MFYFDGEKWQPYNKKVTYTVEVTEYDNDVARFPDNALVEDLTLTDTELARLEVIKHRNMTLSDAEMYIKSGVANGEAMEVDRAFKTKMAVLASLDLATIDPASLMDTNLVRPLEPGYCSKGELVSDNGKLYKVINPHKRETNVIDGNLELIGGV